MVEAVRGRSDLSPEVGQLQHHASQLLDSLRRDGAPVLLSSLPLGTKEKERARRNGSHHSCQADIPFVLQELIDFASKGFWVIMSYDDVKDMIELRLSPIGLVPQRDRRSRIVVDYTFHGVNDATADVACNSMQLGLALQRILQRIYDSDPANGPGYMIKVDISDGFYRVWVGKSGRHHQTGDNTSIPAGPPRFSSHPLGLTDGLEE